MGKKETRRTRLEVRTMERAARFEGGKIIIEKGCYLVLIHKEAGEETFERYAHLVPGDIIEIKTDISV